MWSLLVFLLARSVSESFLHHYLKIMIGNLLQDVCKRITDYLNGDLEAAVRLPHHLIDLERELELEEESEWSYQTLGKKASTEDEEHWRVIIEGMFEKRTMPKHVYADKRFLGGKQFQRAKELLKASMAGKKRCLIFRLLQPLFTHILLHSNYRGFS